VRKVTKVKGDTDMSEVATVTSPGLNLHTAARASAPIVDQLTLGDQLTVDGHSGDWLRGRVTKTKSGKGLGQVGWVNDKYVSVKAVWEADKKVPYAQGEVSNHYGIVALVGMVVAGFLAWFFGYVG
jgi:hypothetical protein